MIAGLTPQEIARFYSKIHIGGCGLVWAGEVNNHGYGRFTIYRPPAARRLRILAHRLIYVLMTGDDPGTSVIRHACDTPRCLTVDCLTPGSQADNIHDAVERGRMNTSGLHAQHAARCSTVTERIRVGVKRCPGCGRVKPFADFGRNRSAIDGVTYKCKACLALYRRTLKQNRDRSAA